MSTEFFLSTFVTLLVIAALAFTFQGVRLTKRALPLRSRGLETDAVVIRVDVRETEERHDDMPVIKHLYTETVRFTGWDGSVREAALPVRNEAEGHAEAGDTLRIRYDPEHPDIAAPVKGSNIGVIGPLLILAGAGLACVAVYLALDIGFSKLL